MLISILDIQNLCFVFLLGVSLALGHLKIKLDRLSRSFVECQGSGSPCTLLRSHAGDSDVFLQSAKSE